ncbi:uncharacterized protein A4U43_C06F6700 [Asparagus officinalis]|uniref:Glycosyltransferase 61 catalytic domain-containing protein n=1 Tax=Asparagus officinalis TaxID=4686 RepID=A0A5P1EK23_ASPOF|nr:uncharacterized protein LOC109846408 [Asparagus officinalis]ONK66338.1 uncharacterized protein A4U43_C06F6700 [Asparagus officinalis]
MRFDPKFVKSFKSFTPVENRRFGLGILAALVLSVTYLSPSAFYSFPLYDVNSHSSSMNAAPTSQMTPESMTMSNVNQSTNASDTTKRDHNGTQLLLDSKDGDQLKILPDIMVSNNSLNLTREQVASNSKLLSGNSTASDEKFTKHNDLKISKLKMEGNSSLSMSSSTSSKTTNTTQILLPSNSNSKSVTEDTKPLCDLSNRRSNVCDMYGDIRIHGKSSSIVFVKQTSQSNETYKIKPYTRKTDPSATARVTELTVRASNENETPHYCTLYQDIPAVVFSVAGYTGNFFHDFTDIWVPLFLTSYQFQGKVQFLVSNYRSWWMNKYRPIVTGLSKYEPIDLDHDDRVQCFQRVIVGLNTHADLKIDPWRSPGNYSMLDFRKFLRKAYSLPRESPLTRNKKKKPRLLVISRSRTRKFTNLKEIIKMSEKLGFEVVVGEAEQNVARFARLVNTCDVLMGVHGAGLTNSLFLPTNAVFIQIVPWGELEWIAKTFFREPAKGMGLKYLEYKIGLEESTLVELYPRDSPWLSDPLSLAGKHGWAYVSEIYLRKQNVKLDVKRFRPVLVKAYELLHEN